MGVFMKITKTEKIWIIVTAFFYILYILPIPAYGDSTGMFIHAALTIVPLWLSVYIGLHRVYKIYRLKK